MSSRRSPEWRQDIDEGLDWWHGERLLIEIFGPRDGDEEDPETHHLCTTGSYTACAGVYLMKVCLHFCGKPWKYGQCCDCLEFIDHRFVRKCEICSCE